MRQIYVCPLAMRFKYFAIHCRMIGEKDRIIRIVFHIAKDNMYVYMYVSMYVRCLLCPSRQRPKGKKKQVQGEKQCEYRGEQTRRKR